MQEGRKEGGADFTKEAESASELIQKQRLKEAATAPELNERATLLVMGATVMGDARFSYKKAKPQAEIRAIIERIWGITFTLNTGDEVLLLRGRDSI